MAKPSSRQELVNYALRQLGAPVLEINIADEQIDDVLDDTIQHFQERHYDGVVRTYLKYEITEHDIARGSDYNPFVSPGISTASLTYPGDKSPTTATFIENSNYIPIPDWVIGVERVMAPREANGGGGFGAFPGLGILGPGVSPYMGGGMGGIGGFYGGGMLDYYLAKQWFETYEFMFNPDTMIRFNKRMDRLYIDFNWGALSGGEVIVIDCYRALDPEEFVKIYNDSWVKKYLTAALKKQWGQNLIKFRGTKLPGGIEMNGREIYDEGVKELDIIKQDMSSTYELPPLDLIG
jgi:hypothetical protein